MHHSFYTQRAAQLCGALPAVAAQQEREAGRAVSPAQPGQLRSSLLPRSLQHVGARPEASASQSAVPSRLPSRAESASTSAAGPSVRDDFTTFVSSAREVHAHQDGHLEEVFGRAVRGGLAGAGSMAVSVCTLMWLRTTVNYQYRYGTSLPTALRALYNDGGRGIGGVLRFYRGVLPALVQGPLARFGDTAANAGTLTLLNEYAITQQLPVPVKTAAASVAAAAFRILIMPIDALKTIMQVEGKAGTSILASKIRRNGPQVLWSGSLGAFSATLVGHYPWFLVFNELNAVLPQYDRQKDLPMYLLRSAGIGFCSSAVSDTSSNAIRVLKTTRQTHKEHVSYAQAAREVIAVDGVRGLFLRGLGTKILSNGVQGIMFTVLWRWGQDYLESRHKEQEAAEGRA